MTKRTIYRSSSDVGPDEALRDSRGRIIDDRYVEEAVADAIDKARPRGRPSLSESGESPLLRVRLSRDLDEAVTKAAEQSGRSRADWVRAVLSQASREAG